MDLDDFGLQISEVRVVEVELALEGPIRHPATAPEQLDDMVQDLIERHGPTLRPFTDRGKFCLWYP
jgi:hypothetical protein